MDINADAPVIAREEIVIEAPIQTILDVQTDVAGWPSRQQDVDGMQSQGPLEVGSTFRWQTAGLAISATVEEVGQSPRTMSRAVRSAAGAERLSDGVDDAATHAVKGLASSAGSVACGKCRRTVHPSGRTR